jgi:hypothetical protein
MSLPAESRPASQPAKRPQPTEEELDAAFTMNEVGAPTRWTVMASIGVALASTIQRSTRIHPDCCAGGQAAVFVGYRVDRKTAIGLQLTTGFFSGSYTYDVFDRPGGTLHIMPIQLGAAILGHGYERLWGAIYMGVHIDRRTDPTPLTPSSPPIDDSVWTPGFGVGVEGGVDVVKSSTQRLGLFGLVQGTLATERTYSSLTLGVAYRR